MRRLVWGKTFARSFKRMTKKHPDWVHDIVATLRSLTTDPFSPGLETHKLKGVLDGSWACSAGYDLRIVFEFVTEPGQKEDSILLIDIGTHDDVY